MHDIDPPPDVVLVVVALVEAVVDAVVVAVVVELVPDVDEVVVPEPVVPVELVVVFEPVVEVVVASPPAPPPPLLAPSSPQPIEASPTRIDTRMEFLSMLQRYQRAQGVVNAPLRHLTSPAPGPRSIGSRSRRTGTWGRANRWFPCIRSTASTSSRP
jgi:hypothetical protein